MSGHGVWSCAQTFEWGAASGTHSLQVTISIVVINVEDVTGIFWSVHVAFTTSRLLGGACVLLRRCRCVFLLSIGLLKSEFSSSKKLELLKKREPKWLEEFKEEETIFPFPGEPLATEFCRTIEATNSDAVTLRRSSLTNNTTLWQRSKYFWY
jgi:hypothetical protein